MKCKCIFYIFPLKIKKVFQYFQVLNLGGKKNVEARGKEALQL